mmetsp:Transcript_1820/g.7940  ORF Transcript_1820/g.7940 Transcript_1820/m.7940 type:complete len:431 (-) Transcript_1820:3012-4304(-)
MEICGTSRSGRQGGGRGVSLLALEDLWLQILDFLEPGTDSARVSRTCRFFNQCACALWAPRRILVSPRWVSAAGAEPRHVRLVTATISAALLRSQPGDLILLEPGDYVESLLAPAHDVWIVGYAGAVLTSPAESPAVTAMRGGLLHIEGISLESSAKTSVVVGRGSALSMYGVQVSAGAATASSGPAPGNGTPGEVLVTCGSVLHLRHCTWFSDDRLPLVPAAKLRPHWSAQLDSVEGPDHAAVRCGCGSGAIRFLGVGQRDAEGIQQAKDAMVKGLHHALADDPMDGVLWRNEELEARFSSTDDAIELASPASMAMLASSLHNVRFENICSMHAVVVGEGRRVHVGHVASRCFSSPGGCHHCQRPCECAEPPFPLSRLDATHRLSRGPERSGQDLAAHMFLERVQQDQEKLFTDLKEAAGVVGERQQQR